MKNENSILMYSVKSTLSKVLVVSLLVVICQFISYYLATNFRENSTIFDILYSMKLVWTGCIGVIIISFINISTMKDNKDSKYNDLFIRLSLTEQDINKNFFKAFLMNYIIYFIIETVGVLLITSFIINEQGFKEDILVNLISVTYVHPYIHGLLPLTDIILIFKLGTVILSMSLISLYLGSKKSKNEKKYLFWILLILIFFDLSQMDAVMNIGGIVISIYVCVAIYNSLLRKKGGDPNENKDQ